MILCLSFDRGMVDACNPGMFPVLGHQVYLHCTCGEIRNKKQTLPRKGHTVFATMRDLGGRNAKNVSEIRALAEKESLPIHVLELDVTNDASVERAVNAAIAKASRIDVAINNAGYYLSGLEEAVTTEQAQRLMDTNFLGPVRVNRAVLPHMRRQRSGVLMHISSGAGR